MEVSNPSYEAFQIIESLLFRGFKNSCPYYENLESSFHNSLYRTKSLQFKEILHNFVSPINEDDFFLFKDIQLIKYFFASFSDYEGVSDLLIAQPAIVNLNRIYYFHIKKEAIPVIYLNRIKNHKLLSLLYISIHRLFLRHGLFLNSIIVVTPIDAIKEDNQRIYDLILLSEKSNDPIFKKKRTIFKKIFSSHIEFEQKQLMEIYQYKRIIKDNLLGIKPCKICAYKEECDKNFFKDC